MSLGASAVMLPSWAYGQVYVLTAKTNLKLFIETRHSIDDPKNLYIPNMTLLLGKYYLRLDT